MPGQYSVGAPGPVVNGGLIDFQDNSPATYLRAPSGEYLQQLSPQQLLAVQQAAVGTSFPVPNVAQPAVLCGPASYIHVNGVTYKPVTEPPGTESVQQSVGAPEPVSNSASSSSSAQNQRPLTEEELHKAIDHRVSVVTEDYINRKLHRRSFSRDHVEGRGAVAPSGPAISRHRAPAAPAMHHAPTGHPRSRFSHSDARPSRAPAATSPSDLEAALRRVKTAVANLPVSEPGSTAAVAAHRHW